MLSATGHALVPQRLSESPSMRLLPLTCVVSTRPHACHGTTQHLRRALRATCWAVFCLLSLAAHAATETPASVPPGLTLHVAAGGNDNNPGTEEQPFASLEKARDTIRAQRVAGALPAGGVVVNVHPGTYRVRQTFALTEQDAGTEAAPVVYRAAAADRPCFTGSVVLQGFSPVMEPKVLDRLPKSANGKVLEANLAEAGVSQPLPLTRGGFASGRGFQTHPEMELFVDGVAMSLAHWPNDGYARIGEATGTLTLQGPGGHRGSPEGRFRFDDERLARWAGEAEGWLYGYWFWTWADSYEKIERIDLGSKEIFLAQPWTTYGYRQGNPFRAVNMLCELDTPGEWYLDRERGKVYLFPQKDIARARVEVSTLPVPFVRADGSSHVAFQGLLWECGAADGLVIEGGESVRLEGCSVRRMAGTGVKVNGGRRHVVKSCDIHSMGRGGIAMSGGNRKTLVPGEHLVENCHIYSLSRIDRTYTPAIWLDGVGNRIRHNQIHDIPSSAMRVEGNDHLVELNEVHHVVLESNDQGAVDMFGNPTYRGNIFRHNYFHHVGQHGAQEDGELQQRAGIRLDDAICGVLMQGNVFQRCGAPQTHFGGVQIHGGKENVVTSNVFVDCGAAVSFSAWGKERWVNTVANALDSSKIDREPYLVRYPELAWLLDNHDANTVRFNAVLRCDKLALRAVGQSNISDNHEDKNAKEFPEGPDGRLIWSASDAERIGVGDIPFETIGLYPDAWR